MSKIKDNLAADKYLQAMEKKAKKENIPIISKDILNFLQLIIRIKKPSRILEIGTAIGYSTINMFKASKEIKEIITIEIDEKKAKEAEKNFAYYELKDRIKVKIGDALDILPYLRAKFDLIFIDGAKGQYPYYLDYVLDLVKVKGLIIADNVLYRGLVENKEKVEHKQRTMVKNLAKYIEIIENHPLLKTSILSIGDGIAVSIKI